MPETVSAQVIRMHHCPAWGHPRCDGCEARDFAGYYVSALNGQTICSRCLATLRALAAGLGALVVVDEAPEVNGE